MMIGTASTAPSPSGPARGVPSQGSARATPFSSALASAETPARPQPPPAQPAANSAPSSKPDQAADARSPSGTAEPSSAARGDAAATSPEPETPPTGESREGGSAYDRTDADAPDTGRHPVSSQAPDSRDEHGEGFSGRPGSARAEPALAADGGRVVTSSDAALSPRSEESAVELSAELPPEATPIAAEALPPRAAASTADAAEVPAVPLAAPPTEAPLAERPGAPGLMTAMDARAQQAMALEDRLQAPRSDTAVAVHEALSKQVETAATEPVFNTPLGLSVSHAATALAPVSLAPVAPAVPFDGSRLLMSEAAPMLAERIRSMVDEQVTEIKLRLDPPKLGSVEVQLAIRDQQVAVSLGSHDAQARMLLAQALPDLAAALAARGLQLMGADVGHPSQGHDEAPAQHLSRTAGQADDDASGKAPAARAAPRGLLDHYA